MAIYKNSETNQLSYLEIHDELYEDSDGKIWYKVCNERVIDESALASQVGGSHYKNFKIQPVEFIHKNGIGFVEGCCIKYLCRWKQKNGVEDLKKAKHFIEMLIEMEEKKC